MKKLAIVGTILIMPLFWPLVFYTGFLKKIDKIELNIYLTTSIGVVTAGAILIQVWWIMFWLGG